MEVYKRRLSLILWRSFIACHISFMVIFIMVMGSIEESGTQNILQLQDAHAFVGVYFQYDLPTSVDNSSEIEVTEAGRVCLPSWLDYNISSHALEGVPMAVNVGFTYIKLIALTLPRLANEDIFAINIIFPGVAATVNLNQRVVTDKTDRKPQQDENGVHYCKPMETRFSVTLMLALPLEAATVSQMVQVVKNFSAFISRTPYEVVLSSKSRSAIHRQRRVEVFSSLREIQENIRWDSQISWHIACNTFPHAKDLEQVLNHNMKSGTFQSILGCPVTGWLLLATFPKGERSSRRQKREVDVFQTPFVTPTLTKMVPSSYVTIAPTSLGTSSLSSSTVNFRLSTLSTSELIKSSPSTFVVSKDRSDDTSQLSPMTQESTIMLSSVVMTSRPQLSSFLSHLQTLSTQVLSSSATLASSTNRLTPSTQVLSSSATLASSTNRLTPSTQVVSSSATLASSTNRLTPSTQVLSSSATLASSTNRLTPSTQVLSSSATLASSTNRLTPSTQVLSSLAPSTKRFVNTHTPSPSLKSSSHVMSSVLYLSNDYSSVQSSLVSNMFSTSGSDAISSTAGILQQSHSLDTSLSSFVIMTSSFYGRSVSFSSLQLITSTIRTLVKNTPALSSFSTDISSQSQTRLTRTLDNSKSFGNSDFSFIYTTSLKPSPTSGYLSMPTFLTSSSSLILIRSSQLFSSNVLFSSPQVLTIEKTSMYNTFLVHSSQISLNPSFSITSPTIVQHLSSSLEISISSSLPFLTVVPSTLSFEVTINPSSQVSSQLNSLLASSSLFSTSKLDFPSTELKATSDSSRYFTTDVASSEIFQTKNSAVTSSLAPTIRITSTYPSSVMTMPSSPVISRIYSSFTPSIAQSSLPITSNIYTSFTPPLVTHLTSPITKRTDVIITQSMSPLTSKIQTSSTPSLVTHPTSTPSLVTYPTSTPSLVTHPTSTPSLVTHPTSPVTSRIYSSSSPPVIQPSSPIASRIDTSFTSPLISHLTSLVTSKIETTFSSFMVTQSTLPITSRAYRSFTPSLVIQPTLPITSRIHTSFTPPIVTHLTSHVSSKIETMFTPSVVTQSTSPVTSKTYTSYTPSLVTQLTSPIMSRIHTSITSPIVTQPTLPITSRVETISTPSVSKQSTLPITSGTSVSYTLPAHTTLLVTSGTSTSYTSPAHTTLPVTSGTSVSYISPAHTTVPVTSGTSTSYTSPAHTALLGTSRTYISFTPSEIAQSTLPCSTRFSTTFTSDSIRLGRSTTSVLHSSPFKSQTSSFYLSSSVKAFTSAIRGSSIATNHSVLQSQTPSLTTPRSLISSFSYSTISRGIYSEETVQMTLDSATQATSVMHSPLSIYHSSMISETERMTAKTMLWSTVQASSGRISSQLSSFSSSFHHGVSDTIAVYSTSNVSLKYSTMRTSLLPSFDASDMFGPSTASSSLLVSMISSIQPTLSQSIIPSIIERTSTIKVQDSTRQISSRITFSIHSHSRSVSSIIRSGNSHLPTTRSFGSYHMRQSSTTPVLTNLPSRTTSLLLSSSFLTLLTFRSSLPTMYSSSHHHHSSIFSRFSSQYVSSSYHLPATTMVSSLNVTTTETAPFTVVPVPILLNPIDNIVLLHGEVFQYVIPADTFYDRQDGDTRNLSLCLLDSNYQSVSLSSWIFLNEEKQSMEGLTVDDDLVDGVHQFYLAAINSAGYVAYDALTLVIMENNAEYNHQFQVNLSLNYSKLQNRFYYVHKFFQGLALYFGGDITEINVFSIVNGSVIVTYSNNSIPETYCDLRGLQDILQLMIHENGSIIPLFQEMVGRQFPIGSVQLKLLGECLRYVTTSSPSATYSPQTSNSQQLWLLLSITVVALLILLFFGFVICLYFRSKHPGEEFLLSEEKPVYIGGRKPTVLENERYIGRKQKRCYPAAVLPDDISPFKTPRDVLALPLKKLPSDPSYSSSGGRMKPPPHYSSVNREDQPPAYQPPPSYPSYYLENNEFV